MGRRNRTIQAMPAAAIVALVAPEAPIAPAPIEAPIEPATDEPDPFWIADADPEVVADIGKANSVVKVAYKRRYAERAVVAGIKRKAAQRSAWDWLAQSIAGECLDERDHISIERFLALLDANGVDHSRWTNRNKGWEGRLRMTGRLALQRVVAEAGVMIAPDGEQLVAPAEWVAKFAR